MCINNHKIKFFMYKMQLETEVDCWDCWDWWDWWPPGDLF